jgi:hypothetical protein
MLALAVTAVSLPMTVSAAEKEIIVNRSVAINRIDDCKEGERANYWVDENFAITPAVFEYMKENQTANLRLEGAYFDFIFDSQKLDNLASTEYWVRNERKAQHDQSIRRKVRSEALQTFYFKINQAFPDGTTMRYQSMFSPGSTVDVYKYDEQTETGMLIATCKVAMGSLMTLPMLETGDYYVLLHDRDPGGGVAGRDRANWEQHCPEPKHRAGRKPLHRLAIKDSLIGPVRNSAGGA